MDNDRQLDLHGGPVPGKIAQLTYNEWRSDAHYHPEGDLYTGWCSLPLASTMQTFMSLGNNSAKKWRNSGTCIDLFAHLRGLFGQSEYPWDSRYERVGLPAFIGVLYAP